jgi:hypothetical protein
MGVLVLLDTTAPPVYIQMLYAILASLIAKHVEMLTVVTLASLKKLIQIHPQQQDVFVVMVILEFLH